MAKLKTVHAYELELRKMIKARTGADMDPWLLPQVRATANNMVLIDKMADELMDQTKLTSFVIGSTGQQKSEMHPLVAAYDKAQRTLMLQLEALGLNYNATPKKITENTKQGGEEHDKLKSLLDDINNV